MFWKEGRNGTIGRKEKRKHLYGQSKPLGMHVELRREKKWIKIKSRVEKKMIGNKGLEKKEGFAFL